MTFNSRIYLNTLLISLVGGVAISLCFVQESNAQNNRLPKQTYYQSFREFYEADYKDAGTRFQRGANTAYRTGTRRYLDSICYWTYVGECYYHLGDYPKAVEMYEESLKLYMSYQRENWQARIQLPPTIQRNNNAFNQARITWGKSRRNPTIARIPNSISVLFGRTDADRVLETGGLVENAELKNVDVVEIMRCTALCLHRRRVIKGPTSKYDPFTQQLITGLRVSGAGNKSLMGSLNGTLLGIALASNEDWKKASDMLNNSLSFGGGMDHPLTSVALLELANIGYKTENYSLAGTLALEASFSAAVFYQYDLVEEALSFGTMIHLMKSKTPYPPLENAIKWAGADRARMMQASLLVRLAECLAEGGQADAAATVLRQTNTPISSRNSLGSAVVNARVKYVGALIQFLKADFRGGMADLNAAIKHFQKGSFWLYRLQLANNLVANNGVNQRQADLLYGVLLRDPSDLDWQTDPFESLTFLASPHVRSLETWFDIVVDRKDFKRAFELGDQVRRHRFFGSLPLGGRLMSFRWVMHSPVQALTANALAQRQKFLAKNTVYAKFAQRADQIRDSLLALPLQPDGKEELEQKKLFIELNEISLKQEAILASYALRREPAEMAFPPQGNIADLQNAMKSDQIALVTLSTAKGYSVFLLSKQASNFIGVFSDKDILRGVAKLIKEMKISVIAMDVGELEETAWKEGAEELKDLLFGAIEDYSWGKYQELVVIPDGVLWYIPFEALPVDVLAKKEADAPEAIVEVADAGDAPVQKEFLSQLVHVRYSPTLFLAFGTQRPWKEVERSAVVTGRMFARTDDELAKSEFEELKKKLPNAVAYEKTIRTPTNYLASLFDQLVVWNEMKSTKGKHFTLNPTQMDQSKVGATIAGWMPLPWFGPEHIVIPGFHSDGGQGLRTKQRGNDLFLTSMGLMASGTRSTLISRWATGGKAAVALTREYSSTLDSLGAKESLRRSQISVREMDLDYEKEPRIRAKKSDSVLKAEHPYFWASLMLIDIPSEDMPAHIKAEREEQANVAADGKFEKEDAKPEEAKPKEAKPADAKPKEAKPKGLFAKPKSDGKKGK